MKTALCMRQEYGTAIHLFEFVCWSETPLSVAMQAGLSLEGIRVLLQGGAHLDFRSRDSLTPVHKAVRAHNHTGLMVRKFARLKNR